MPFDRPIGALVLDFREPGEGPDAPEEMIREDLSAVARTGDHLWFANDETAAVERLSTGDGTLFAGHRRFGLAEIFDLPDAPDEEMDIEGLEADGPYLWVAGSHSLTRKKPKAKHSDEKALKRLTVIRDHPNRRFLGRLPLADRGDGPEPVREVDGAVAASLPLAEDGGPFFRALRDDVHFGPFLDVPAKENGFDIEGLAARGNRVFLGLRGPVLRGWATILQLELDDAEPGVLQPRPVGEDGQLYRKHFLDLRGLGVRDLVAQGDDLLILAGPTMDLDGPVFLYRWAGAAAGSDERLVRRDALPAELTVPYGTDCDHAEGIALWPAGDGGQSLLVVYDGPAPERRLAEGRVLADLFAPG